MKEATQEEEIRNKKNKTDDDDKNQNRQTPFDCVSLSSTSCLVFSIFACLFFSQTSQRDSRVESWGTSLERKAKRDRRNIIREEWSPKRRDKREKVKKKKRNEGIYSLRIIIIIIMKDELFSFLSCIEDGWIELLFFLLLLSTSGKLLPNLNRCMLKKKK